MPPNPASASQVILCLNSGSSSLKFALYRLGVGEEVRLAHGAAAQGRLVIAHLGNGASLAAVLGGLDTLVFTGGIGERAALVRWEVCRGLAYLGIDVDPQKNAVHADVISTPGSACTVRVIPTNEDLMIARHTRTLLVSSSAAQRP